MKEEKLSGVVWSGFIGEEDKPPVYIIPAPDEEAIFINDFLRPYVMKHVTITVEITKPT